jgi:hypothetical protein
LYSLSTTSSLVPPWNGILSPLSLKPAYTVSGVQWHKRNTGTHPNRGGGRPRRRVDTTA